MTYRHDLWEIAVDNHGIVTTRQAEDAGIPAVEVRKLATRGALRRVGRGVYRHLLAPADRYTEFATVVQEAGDTAFLQRESVLSLFGLADVNPAAIHVGDRRRNRAHLPERVVLEKRDDLTDSDLTVYEGIPMTTVAQALMDCLPHLMTERAAAAARDAAAEGLIDDDEHAEISAALRRRKRTLTAAA